MITVTLSFPPLHWVSSPLHWVVRGGDQPTKGGVSDGRYALVPPTLPALQPSVRTRKTDTVFDTPLQRGDQRCSAD